MTKHTTWETEFDKLRIYEVSVQDEDSDVDVHPEPAEYIKSFIREKIEEARREGREEAVKFIDSRISRSKNETEGMYLHAWNRVLEEALTNQDT